jgi:hypothetical protein
MQNSAACAFSGEFIHPWLTPDAGNAEARGAHSFSRLLKPVSSRLRQYLTINLNGPFLIAGRRRTTLDADCEGQRHSPTMRWNWFSPHRL